MKLALLGADHDSLLLSTRAVADAEHQLVWACDTAGHEAELLAAAPEVTLTDDWESLLSGTVVDAVIVGRGAPEAVREEQLRHLVQEAVPLLVMHPIHQSMLFYYELDMIRRETGCVMLPYLPARWHPAIERLQDLIADRGDEGLGRIEQLVFERAMGERNRRRVLAQFAIDVDLLRSLGRDFDRLTATAPSEEAARYANLAVALSGPHDVVARWSVGPVEHEEGARLTVVAERANLRLWVPANSNQWHWTLAADDRAEDEYLGREWDPAGAALAQLAAALEGHPVEPSWPDASRDIELAETIDRSLERRRTIELHDEDYSEQSTFKGTMTSLGCGLLVFSMLMLFAAAIAARMGVPLAEYWALFLLALMLVFLLLQIFRLVFPSEASEK